MAVGGAGSRNILVWRDRLKQIVESKTVERLIIGLIVLNAITLGLETSKSTMAVHGKLLHALDNILLTIFVIELGSRMVAHGWRFWRDPWSVFDFVVVAIALMPDNEALGVLRSLRILRALRLISAVPSMKRVVNGLLAAVPSMGSIIMLLMLLNYVYAVMATKLFGNEFEEHFGTIGASFFTFFQIMTLEGWSQEIVRPVMNKFPYAWVFFVPYIVLATFMVLNLFIGIVVDAMQQQSQESAEKVIRVTESEYHQLMAELTSVRSELRLMKSGQELPPLPPPRPG